ncbi:hypothetical protein B0H10DRAFT_2064821, partial [Mycena sp. CBHHK59/15]
MLHKLSGSDHKKLYTGYQFFFLPFTLCSLYDLCYSFPGHPILIYPRYSPVLHAEHQLHHRRLDILKTPHNYLPFDFFFPFSLLYVSRSYLLRRHL